MTDTTELQTTITEKLADGPMRTEAIAESLSLNVKSAALRAALKALTASGQAHCTRGKHAAWHAGPAPEKPEGEAKRRRATRVARTSQKPRGAPITANGVSFQGMTGSMGAIQAPSQAVAAFVAGIPADILRSLLAASDERLNQIDRVLGRLAP